MYRHIALGGTFDHFHAGHRRLIDFALENANKITIGITKKNLFKKKKHIDQIESFSVRYTSVEKYVHKKPWNAKLIPINTVYGSTLEDTSIDAIVVTKETVKGAERINAKRREMGLTKLAILVCPYVLDSMGDVLSSTAIRQGIVDREGFRYDQFLSDHSFILQSHSKIVLRRPFGKIIHYPIFRRLRNTVLVGDIVTHTFLTHKLPFSVAYIDASSKRKPTHVLDSYSEKITKTSLENPAGTLRAECSQHVAQQLTKQQSGTIFFISGEEDLLTLPCVLLAPLGTLVVYGYPFTNPSMRAITSTERIKKKFLSLLQESI